ncbi:hypothetical protein C8Q79DRAFT_994876 [Trametes meyenii]|nr:hypothetical protein C8Q79DRAFT_994876 [Trametes meyenii]
MPVTRRTRLKAVKSPATRAKKAAVSSTSRETRASSKALVVAEKTTNANSPASVSLPATGSSSRGRRALSAGTVSKQSTPRASRSTPSGSARSTSSKRKAEPGNENVEASPSRTPKRRRTTIAEDELQARAKRLKEAEKDLRLRQAEVKKREAAANKKHKTLDQTEQTLSREHGDVLERRRTLIVKTRALDAQMKTLQLQQKTLDARERSLNRQAERQSAAGMSLNGTLNPARALDMLEEHYTCSLCYETMACPYTLTAGQCGHSFCALCLMQWCFAAVHRGCGYWHDSLECPLCRAELPYASDVTPRSVFSFPFTPNRLADGMIKTLVAVVKDAKPDDAPTAGQGACPTAGAGVGTGEDKSIDPSAVSDRLALWREGGAMYNDWVERDTRGRKEITRLATGWSTFQAEDFIEFKDRLTEAA